MYRGVARVRFVSCIIVLLLCMALVPGVVAQARAQKLPYSATPRGVVFTFLTETASSSDTIDRAAFSERLTGEFARTEPGSFRGLLPAGSRFRIDTIPNLVSDDDLRRAAAYVTVEIGGERENWYFFCVRDSIWRLEALRRLPTASQRAQMRESLEEIDTSTASYRLLRSDLQRLLLPDEGLRELFTASKADAEKIVKPLDRGKLWNQFAMREVDFSRLEEYRELDDDIDYHDRIFYTLDRGAIERLKYSLGLRRIERDPRYPGLIFFVAGDIDKSSVGFVHAAVPDMLPGLSRDGFIMLRPASEGWWLYKRVR